MCLSVRKTFETCCGSISGLLEARQEIMADNHQNETDDDAVEEKIFISDRLALVTQATRKFLIECKNAAGSLQKSAIYR